HKDHQSAAFIPFSRIRPHTGDEEVAGWFFYDRSASTGTTGSLPVGTTGSSQRYGFDLPGDRYANRTRGSDQAAASAYLSGHRTVRPIPTRERYRPKA